MCQNIMRKIKVTFLFTLLVLISACGTQPTATLVPTPLPTLTLAPTTLPTLANFATATETKISITATATIPAFTLTALPSATFVAKVAATAKTATSVSPTLPPPSAASSPTATALSPTLAPTLAPTRVVPTQLAQNVARGAQLFVQMKCASCHIKPARGRQIAPDLSHIATDAAQIIRSPDYHGTATDVPSFLFESITNPNAFVQPPYGNLTVDGKSLMPTDFAQQMTLNQIQDLVAYLLTKR